MGDSKAFKSISVKGPSPKDEVIQAGITTPAADRVENLSQDQPASESNTSAAAQNTQPSAKSSATSTPSLANSPAKNSKETANPMDEFTNLEPQAMGTTQRVVIIAAILLILVAAAYCLGFLR